MKLLWRILDNKHKNFFIILIFLLFISSLLEMIGISLVVPIVLNATDQNLFENYPFISIIKNFFYNLNPNQISFYLIIFILVIYIIKNLLLIFISLLESRFVVSVNEITSQKLFKNILNQDYNFHLETHSSIIQTRFRIDLMAFGNAIVSFTNLIADFLIFVSITSLLIFFDKKLFIIIILFLMLFVSLFYFFIQKKVKKYGLIKQLNEQIRSKKISENISAIKIIKAFSLEEIFFKDYKKISESLRQTYTKWMFFNSIPKSYFEVVGIFSLAFLAFVILFFFEDKSNFIGILALYATASFRLLPSVNRMVLNYSRINFATPSVKLIYNDLKKSPKKNINNSKVIDKFKSFKLSNISFSYEKGKNLINKLNLTINKKDKVLILGSSGSGKSTLVDIILGIKKPSAGKLLINGTNFSNKKYTLKKICSYVPQSIFLFDTTIKDNITMFEKNTIKNINVTSIDKTIDISCLDSFISDRKNNLQTLIGENGVKISGGQRQRIGLAREIYKNKEIYILDESTSSLDKETEKDFYKKFFEFACNKTVIIISHNNLYPNYFNKIITIKEMENKK
jgi:ABC-type multidrug transport system fused ATPase/permease subunit